MATLNTQEIKRAGMTPAYVAASAGGDRFHPGKLTFLHVKNAGGSPETVTVAATAKVEGDLALAPDSVVVAAGSEAMLGPFPPQLFTALDGSGLADISYTGVTSVTVAVLDLGA